MSTHTHPVDFDDQADSIQVLKHGAVSGNR